MTRTQILTDRYRPAALVAYALCLGAVFLIPVEWLREYGNLAVLFAALAGTYFVIGNLKYSRWSRSEEGVHVVVFSTLITVALWWIFASRFAFTVTPRPLVGEYLVQLRFGVCVYVSLFYAMLWRAVIFTRVQLAARRQKASSNQASP